MTRVQSVATSSLASVAFFMTVYMALALALALAV